MSSTILPNPRRGEVWDVNFDPTIGTEIQKIRPAVVVNINSIRHLQIRLIAPITSWKARFSGKIWLVKVQPDNANGLTMESAVDAFQMRPNESGRYSMLSYKARSAHGNTYVGNWRGNCSNY